VRSKVEEVMQVIRPAVQADGGDIVLFDVNEETGIVIVELRGSCLDCPKSETDLKFGVERILKARIAGINEVVAIT